MCKPIEKQVRISRQHMVLKTSSLVSAWVMRVQKMFRLKRISLSLLLIVQNILTFTEILCKMDTQICLANYHLSYMFFLMFLCTISPIYTFQWRKRCTRVIFIHALRRFCWAKQKSLKAMTKVVGLRVY